jgi:O-antigen/teichoic acid export membrane protein
VLPIAAENLPSSLYTPLVVLLAAYVVTVLLANRSRGHDDTGGTDRWETIGFGIVVVSALYTIVLVIATIFNYPSRSTDMVTILIVICGFFALLLFVFFVLAEWLPQRLRGSRSER